MMVAGWLGAWTWTAVACCQFLTLLCYSDDARISCVLSREHRNCSLKSLVTTETIHYAVMVIEYSIHQCKRTWKLEHQAYGMYNVWYTDIVTMSLQLPLWQAQWACKEHHAEWECGVRAVITVMVIEDPSPQFKKNLDFGDTYYMESTINRRLKTKF